MAHELSEEDEEDNYYTPVTDPVIKRYSNRLGELLAEFKAETQDYQLNREQIDQFADCLETFRTLVVMEQDLAEMDGMLRLFFAREYYGPDEIVTNVLVRTPTGTEN